MTVRYAMIARCIDAILFASRIVVFCTSVLFVVLVVLQVFFRYALNDSIVWAEEAIRFLLYVTVVMSLGVVAAADADIRLGGLETALPPVWRRLLLLLCDAIVLIFCAVFVYASVLLVGLSWRQTSPVMSLSMAWVYSAGLLGFILVVLGTIRKLLFGPFVSGVAEAEQMFRT